MKSRTGFDACGSVVSAGGIGKESVSTGVGNCTDSEGGTLRYGDGNLCREI